MKAAFQQHRSHSRRFNHVKEIFTDRKQFNTPNQPSQNVIDVQLASDSLALKDICKALRLLL